MLVNSQMAGKQHARLDASAHYIFVQVLRSPRARVSAAYRARCPHVPTFSYTSFSSGAASVSFAANC
jgi:hypothetical protein